MSLKKVIIIEGLYALYITLRDIYQYNVWIDTSIDTRMQRVEDRDGSKYLGLWEECYVPREMTYIATQRPFNTADVFIMGSDIGWPQMHRPFARNCSIR